MGTIYKRPGVVRTMGVGKQVTVPVNCNLESGDKVNIIYDGFMLIVPIGATVNETKLVEAIGLPKDN